MKTFFQWLESTGKIGKDFEKEDISTTDDSENASDVGMDDDDAAGAWLKNKINPKASFDVGTKPIKASAKKSAVKVQPRKSLSDAGLKKMDDFESSLVKNMKLKKKAS